MVFPCLPLPRFEIISFMQFSRLHATALITLANLLIAIQPATADDSITIVESDASLVIQRGGSPILTYHIAEVAPPEGVDPIFRRSGFIYPLHAPSGGIVTGIHPDDHYHHLGLWHAWVNTEWGDRKPDFWNLGDRSGRIRYAGTREVRDSGFTVAQEQIAYLKGIDADPTVILDEALSVDAAFVEGANVIDYVIKQTNITDKPLKFPAYRYGGGLAFRAPHSWGKSNSEYLTSKGLKRADSHTSRARWVAMFGPAENGDGKDATVLILCHPKNHDAPQHIRTWDKGEVFFNYVPIQESDWSIEPRQTITLRYRIVILDGRVEDPVALESRWQDYTLEK